AFEVRSARAAYSLDLGTIGPVERPGAYDLPIDLSDIGGTDGHDITLRAVLPAGMTWAGAGTEWRACPGMDGAACLTVPTLSVDGPAISAPLTVVVLGNPDGAETEPIVVTATDADGNTTTARTTVRLLLAQAVVLGLPALLQAGEAGTVSLVVTNTGSVPLSELEAGVYVDAPLQLLDGAATDEWTCDQVRGGPSQPDGRCTTDRVLQPGQSSTLAVDVMTPSNAEERAYSVKVRLTAPRLAAVHGTSRITVVAR
ncbi:MAG TPA: hypothetical protein VGK17_23980, partial [Propionicimonas sp.]